MSPRYSLAEARAALPSILDQVESGADIELTRHGKPVAFVVSVRAYELLNDERVTFSAAYDRFLTHHRLKEAGVQRNFAHGLRDRSSGRKVVV